MFICFALCVYVCACVRVCVLLRARTEESRRGVSRRDLRGAVAADHGQLGGDDAVRPDLPDRVHVRLSWETRTVCKSRGETKRYSFQVTSNKGGVFRDP